MSVGWRAIGACVLAGVLATPPHAATAPADDATPMIDACALLDAAEIQRVVGEPVEKGERRDSGLEANGAYSSACVWMLSADRGRETDSQRPLGGRSFVILNALRWPQGSEGARTYLQAFREASASGVLPLKPSPRPFGDEALWWGDGLAVRRGDVSFGVSIFIQRETASDQRQTAGDQRETAGDQRQTAGDPKHRAGEREEHLAKRILARLDAQARRR